MMTQAGFLAESLFRVFDEDNSGALSFYEFAQVLIFEIIRNFGLKNIDDYKQNWL